MDRYLSLLLQSFKSLCLLVLGDATLDSYLEGITKRICREAPVPTVTLSCRHDVPGGAANTAVNVAGLGARVDYLAVVGDDLEAAFLRRCLAARGVPTEHVLTQPGRRTLAKHRIVAAGQILLRFDQGDTGAISEPTERAVLDRLVSLFPRTDAVIVSDYGAGLIGPRVIERLRALRSQRPRVLVVDSRNRLAAFRSLHPTAVKPNYEEAVGLLGACELEGFTARADGVALYGEGILDLAGAQMAVVTLDHDGAILFERGRPPYRTYARPARNPCVAGAGDTFVAALALALAAGADSHTAVELASAAAAVVVAKEGTACCSARELDAYLSPGETYIPNLDRLAARVDLDRQEGKRIVFTNGCFDILHRGHVTYLNHAKALGDVLVVGLNSDESIRRLKGPDRPVNTLEDRIGVLSALSCIDHIIDFDEDTSCNLVRALRPDVFVKGGDYTRDSLPEAPLVEELGGVVSFLPYLEDLSTTGLIRRIRQGSRAER